MARTTISLADPVELLAKRVCEMENRNFSNLCEVALTAYCESRQGVAPYAEIIATAQELGVDESAAVLARALKRKIGRKAA